MSIEPVFSGDVINQTPAEQDVLSEEPIDRQESSVGEAGSKAMIKARADKSLDQLVKKEHQLTIPSSVHGSDFALPYTEILKQGASFFEIKLPTATGTESITASRYYTLPAFQRFEGPAPGYVKTWRGRFISRSMNRTKQEVGAHNTTSSVNFLNSIFNTYIRMNALEMEPENSETGTIDAVLNVSVKKRCHGTTGKIIRLEITENFGTSNNYSRIIDYLAIRGDLSNGLRIEESGAPKFSMQDYVAQDGNRLKIPRSLLNPEIRSLFPAQKKSRGLFADWRNARRNIHYVVFNCSTLEDVATDMNKKAEYALISNPEDSSLDRFKDNELGYDRWRGFFYWKKKVKDVDLSDGQITGLENQNDSFQLTRPASIRDESLDVGDLWAFPDVQTADSILTGDLANLVLGKEADGSDSIPEYRHSTEQTALENIQVTSSKPTEKKNRVSALFSNIGDRFSSLYSKFKLTKQVDNQPSDALELKPEQPNLVSIDATAAEPSPMFDYQPAVSSRRNYFLSHKWQFGAVATGLALIAGLYAFNRNQSTDVSLSDTTTQAASAISGSAATNTSPVTSNAAEASGAERATTNNPNLSNKASSLDSLASSQPSKDNLKPVTAKNQEQQRGEYRKAAKRGPTGLLEYHLGRRMAPADYQKDGLVYQLAAAIGRNLYREDQSREEAMGISEEFFRNKIADDYTLNEMDVAIDYLLEASDSASSLFPKISDHVKPRSDQGTGLISGEKNPVHNPNQSHNPIEQALPLSAAAAYLGRRKRTTTSKAEEKSGDGNIDYLAPTQKELADSRRRSIENMLSQGTLKVNTDSKGRIIHDHRSYGTEQMLASIYGKNLRTIEKDVREAYFRGYALN